MPPSPVKRIEVQPAGRTITAGDSVRLTLRALDESASRCPTPCSRQDAGRRGRRRHARHDHVAGRELGGQVPARADRAGAGHRAVRRLDLGRVPRRARAGGAGGGRAAAPPRSSPGSRSGSARSPSPRPTTARSTRCAGSRSAPKVASVDRRRRHHRPRRRHARRLTASVRGASASLDVRVRAGEPIGNLDAHARAGRPCARATWCAFTRRGARRGRQADHGAHADLELLPRRRPARRRRPVRRLPPRDLHGDRDARPARGEHHRHGERARRAPVGHRGRPAAAHRLRHVRSLDPSQRQGRLPRHPHGRRPGLRHRHHQSRRNPGGGRLDHGEHAAGERHADHAPTATTWSSPARAPPTARTASSSPTPTIRSTRRRSPSSPTASPAGVHSVYIYENPKYGRYVLPHQRRHRRDRHRQHHRPGQAGPRRRVAHRPPRRRALRARPRHRGRR